MHLFHYHLVTSELRDVEARYIGKLGFDLVARYGRVGDDHVSVEAGVELGAARPRRVQAAARASSSAARSTSSSSRGTGGCRGSTTWGSRSTRTSSRRCSRGRRSGTCACRSTAAGARSWRRTPGYRIEVHPPRDWIDDLLANQAELRLAELQLKADEPRRQGRSARGHPRPRARRRRLGDGGQDASCASCRTARKAARSWPASASPSPRARSRGLSLGHGRTVTAGGRSYAPSSEEPDPQLRRRGCLARDRRHGRRPPPRGRRVHRRDRLRRLRGPAPARREPLPRRVDRRRRHEARPRPRARDGCATAAPTWLRTASTTSRPAARIR